MKKVVLIEGILLFVLSFVSLREAVHLIRYRDPHILYDVLGPGYYVLFLSLALMATGIVHLVVHYRKRVSVERIFVNKGMGIRVLSIVGILALYNFLINITGYLMATIIFFLLEFRAMGIESWKVNVIITVVSSAVYYILFVKCCSMVFPRGIFFYF